MGGQSRGDVADLVAGVGRHWGWLLFFAVINILAGLAALLWPGPTLAVIAVLFGVELIVAGVFRFVAAFAVPDESGSARVLLALLGAISLIVGLYAVRHLLITLTALALILGIFWIVNGVVEVFTALSHRGTAMRGWTVAMGVLSIIAGLVVLVYPGPSLLVMTLVLGVWLIVFGVMEAVMAFRLRSATPGTAPSALAGSRP